jgi:hypothetical protein
LVIERPGWVLEVKIQRNVIYLDGNLQRIRQMQVIVPFHQVETFAPEGLLDLCAAPFDKLYIEMNKRIIGIAITDVTVLGGARATLAVFDFDTADPVQSLMNIIEQGFEVR